MSRISHFYLAIALAALSCCWCIVGVVLFISYPVGTDSVAGGSPFDASDIVILICWCAIFLAIIGGLLLSFKHALMSSPKDLLTITEPAARPIAANAGSALP
jgi:hypothetical protein